MRSVSVLMTDRAKRDLRSLDARTARRILEKVETYARSQNPLRHAKPLKSVFEGLYRFRIGEYRVIFRSDRDGKLAILLILRIGHRKDIYQR